MNNYLSHFLLFLCLSILFPLSVVAQKEFRTQLDNVKDASFYDSLALFDIGEKTIGAAKQQRNMAVIAEVHIYYGNYFIYTEQTKIAKQYYEKAHAEALACNNAHLIILSEIRLAYLDIESGRKEEGLKKYEALLQQAQQNKDYENMCDILNLQGIQLESTNKETEAVALYLKGISIAEEHQLSYYPGVFLNNIGLIKYYTGEYDAALADFEEGLALAKKFRNKRLANHIEINLCIVYLAKNEPDKAFPIFNNVIAYSRKYNFPLELGSNYINLSSALINAGKSDEGLRYIDSAIAVFEKFNMPKQLAMALVNKESTLLEMHQLPELDAVRKRIKNIADSIHDLETSSNFQLMEYSIYADQKNYAQALESYKEHIRFKDSLNQNMNAKVIAEMQQNQRVQQKEIELEKERSKTLLFEKTAQAERSWKWLSIAGALVAIVFLVSILYSRYSKQLKEKQEQFSRELIKNIEEERNRISRDLHDDIGQSLSVIKSKVIKEKELIPKTGTQLEQELSRVIEQTRELSRNLYPTHLEKIGLSRAIANLLENVQANTQLQCSFEIDESVEKSSLQTKTHLFRIIQECINNTIKHANASALKLTIQERNGYFELSYKDNGQGLKIRKNHLSLGLQSIQERAKIIHGNLELSEKSEKGFRLILTFKK